MNDDDEGVLLPGLWSDPVQIPGQEGDDTPLSQDQDRRAFALHHARTVLERRGMPLSGKDSSIPPNVADLIRVANYILIGREKP